MRKVNPPFWQSINFFFSLREIDIELMRRLSPRVNVIPVIGRADSFTPQELRDFKKRVIFSVKQLFLINEYTLFLDYGRY